MLEALISVPAYNPEIFPGITEEMYEDMTAKLAIHITRAIELFDAYWRTSNTALFDMSLEALKQAHASMFLITECAGSTALLDKLSCRAAFTYDLAAAMLGGTLTTE